MRKLIVIICAMLLSGCAFSYDGHTNQWRNKATGVVIGCSDEEDEPIHPCP